MDSLKSKFALLSVIIVCVSILFASLLARSVVRPIGSLEQAARKLAEGEFTTPLPGPRHDEIGVLTTSFASMCNAIMTNESKLTDAANRHKRTSEQLQIALEEKVTAETASLHKSQFLANMSHEIRTPMNGVLGVTDLLLHTDLTDPQRSLTKTIRRSGKSLLSIINDILDFSKIEAGHLQIDPADFNLLMAIEDINGLLRDSAMTKGVEYHCYVANTVMRRVRGDQHRIRQVLTNLIGNAIKFTSAGEVTIHVTCDGTGVDRITRFEVRDTGIGMTPDALERVFESFHQGDETTTRKFGGTGLGLTISKQLVEMMGGDIGVESTEDVGSVFWFTVPLEEARPQVPKIEAVASQSSLPEPAGNPPARVLLAEDNAVNKLVAEGMLRLLGYEFRSVENGREVLTALNDERFDVVLMDCHMLLMDGFDTTQAIRQQEAEGPCQRLPIVALTANAMEGDEEKCLAAGMDDYLAKPFEQEDLGETLRRWVA